MGNNSCHYRQNIEKEETMEYSVTFTWEEQKVVKVKGSSLPAIERKVNILAEEILSQKKTSEIGYEATDEEGTTYQGWIYS